MKVIQSYWFSKFRSDRSFGGFYDERVFWYSALLSAFSIAKYYEVEFVTDTYGSECVNYIGFPYRSASIEFDRLPQQLSGLWALGKLSLYAKQEQPFLHIDLDAYLWERLPQRCEQAEVAVQVYEDDPRQVAFYRAILQQMQNRLPYLPESYRTLDLQNRKCFGLNCGVVGGSRTDLFRAYSAESLEIAKDSRNAEAWTALESEMGTRFGWLNAALEQTNLLLWCEREKVQAEALVPNAFAPGRNISTEKLGFTHLVGEEKQNKRIQESLRARIQKAHPQQLKRIDEMVGASRSA